MANKLTSMASWLLNGIFALAALAVFGAFLFPHPPIDEIPGPADNTPPACLDRVTEFQELKAVYKQQLPDAKAIIDAAGSPDALKKAIGKRISHDAENTPYGRLNWLANLDETYVDTPCKY